MKANLSGVDLRGTLRGAYLSNANLREAKLEGADLWGSTYYRAELQGVTGLESNPIK